MLQASHVSKNRFLLPGLILFFFVVDLIFVFLNHRYFRTNALDYGFYNQVFSELAHFRRPASTVFQPHLSHLLQVHASLTLYFLVPLYWIFNFIFHSYTLLFIQTLFFALGGYGTYLYIKEKTKNEWFALLGIVHFHLLWGHYGAMTAEYIDTSVAASVVPLFFYLFEKERWKWATVAFIFIISAKENMPIWMLFIAAFLFITSKGQKQKRKMLIGYTVFSLIYLVFAFKFLIPHFEDPALKYWGFAYSDFGSSPGNLIVNCVKHPWHTFISFFTNHTYDKSLNDIKSEFYMVFLFSGGLFLFLNPRYFLLFFPVIAQKVLNDSFLRWGINTFYSVEIVSILSFSAILCIDEISDPLLKKRLVLFLLAATALTTLIKLHDRTTPGYQPDKENFLRKEFYLPTFDIKKANALLKMIPHEAAVSASSEALPHIADRLKIYPYPDISDAEFIYILENKAAYPLNFDQYTASIDTLIASPYWDVVAEQYPAILFRKLKAGEIKKPFSRNQQLEFISSCDAERVDTVYRKFLSEKGEPLYNDISTRTSEFAHSGMFSARVDGSDPYCMTYFLPAYRSGETFKTEVYRKGNKKGCIYVTFNGMDMLTIASKRIVETDSSGWDKLSVTFVVPENLPEHSVKIFCSNSEGEPSYFDDFKVYKVK